MKSLLNKSINLVSIVSIIAILYVSLLSFEVFVYTLEIRSYGVPGFMGQSGVDLVPTNTYTSTYYIWQYPGLPPLSVFMNFADSAMPIGSEVSVCAYYHDNGQLINCKNYVAGWSTAEYITINLSPYNSYLQYLFLFF
jgi:hypothetical protein